MAEISLCMIVRDERETLARCLDSVKEAVDEIIIVDTGSKDETREIARRYTPHVYDFFWKDDFSAARNESLRMQPVIFSCGWMLTTWWRTRRLWCVSSGTCWMALTW